MTQLSNVDIRTAVQHEYPVQLTQSIDSPALVSSMKSANLTLSQLESKNAIIPAAQLRVEGSNQLEYSQLGEELTYVVQDESAAFRRPLSYATNTNTFIA
jgi:hypothetical protein